VPDAHEDLEATPPVEPAQSDDARLALRRGFVAREPSNRLADHPVACIDAKNEEALVSGERQRVGAPVAVDIGAQSVRPGRPAAGDRGGRG
jgi:hypothetical protein